MVRTPKEEATELCEVTLDEISGGPKRHVHDHIGNFNFKVEIEGATQGAFKGVDGLQTELDTALKKRT
ncbi:MAG: hypothetical protein AB8B85_12760 [Paracoccaceae bacterium]